MIDALKERLEKRKAELENARIFMSDETASPNSRAYSFGREMEIEDEIFFLKKLLGILPDYGEE